MVVKTLKPQACAVVKFQDEILPVLAQVGGALIEGELQLGVGAHRDEEFLTGAGTW
jgi:hypothetical protein